MLALLKAERPTGGLDALIHASSGVAPLARESVMGGERQGSPVVHCGLSTRSVFAEKHTQRGSCWHGSLRRYKRQRASQLICDGDAVCYCSITWHILTDTMDNSSVYLPPYCWAFGLFRFAAVRLILAVMWAQATARVLSHSTLPHPVRVNYSSQRSRWRQGLSLPSVIGKVWPSSSPCSEAPHQGMSNDQIYAGKWSASTHLEMSCGQIVVFDTNQ